MSWRRITPLLLSLLLLLSTAASAAPALGGQLNLKTHDPKATALLNQILDTAFWSGADRDTYTGKLYDEIWIKRYDDGIVSLVTGQGEQDYIHDVVADIVFLQQKLLPQYEDGAVRVLLLGQGTDPVNGLPYTDTFFYLDMTFLYATYTQRMYRLETEDGRTILFFERLKDDFVDAETWAAYQARITEASDSVNRRWPPLNAVVPVDEITGMFIISPGETRQSRVTFVNKLSFADDASFVARWGSEMSPVIRAGLQSGFVASVAMARVEQARRASAAP